MGNVNPCLNVFGFLMSPMEQRQSRKENPQVLSGDKFPVLSIRKLLFFYGEWEKGFSVESAAPNSHNY